MVDKTRGDSLYFWGSIRNGELPGIVGGDYYLEAMIVDATAELTRVLTQDWPTPSRHKSSGGNGSRGTNWVSDISALAELVVGANRAYILGRSNFALPDQPSSAW